MAEILVFCEKDDVAFELVSKGKEFKGALGMSLAAALLGKDAAGKADDYFAYGADKVYVGEDAALADFTAEAYAEALYQIAQKNGAEVLLLGSTKRGKELAPRVAQKLGAGCVTDANDVRVEDGKLVADRYALGGNTVSSGVVKTAQQVFAVMPKTCELGAKVAKQGDGV